VTGRNNALMGTEANDVAFEMMGTAVWEVGQDGRLCHNFVERNAFEVYGVVSRKDGWANKTVGLRPAAYETKFSRCEPIVLRVSRRFA